MKILRPGNEIEFNKKSIFLAGTMPHQGQADWREQVIQALKETEYDGIVFNPDYSAIPENSRLNYGDQILWEITAMKSSAIVCFWIDREFPTHPGLTTNVEFGYWVRSSKVLYGRPHDDEKCFYLDYVYRLEQNREPVESVDDLVKELIKMIKGAKN